MCEPMMSLSLTKNYKLSTCVYLHLEKQKLQKKKKETKILSQYLKFLINERPITIYYYVAYGKKYFKCLKPEF